MARTASGISITKVSTDKLFPLGEEVEVWDATNGPQIWRYVWNDEAATAFAAGDVIIRDPSATTEKTYGGLQAAAATVHPRVQCLGVAQHAIAAGSYGFVLRKGKGLMRAGSANITTDVALTTGGDAAGTVIDFADGNPARISVIGFSLEGEAGNNTTFDAFIDIP